MFRKIGKYARLLFLLALLQWCGFGALAQVNAEQVTAIGRNVLSMDDYMLSIQYFNLAIKAKPYLAEPYYYRGLAKLMLEDYEGSERDCSLALDRNKFLTEAYRVRGFARARLGKDSLAVRDFDSGLEYNPLDRYFLLYKASSQTSMKDYKGAHATFESLEKNFPHFDEAFAERARLALVEKDTVKALEQIEKVIALRQDDAAPYLFRASIRAGKKMWKEAREDMDKAVSLQPREPELYVNRAYLRYNEDDYFGAMSDYNYALELDPGNAAATYNRALLRYEVRDLRRAKEDFGRVLKADPSNFHARYARALISLELRQSRDAIGDFNEIMKVYPRFYPIYYGLAQAYRDLGDIKTAMANYQKGEKMVRGYVRNPQANPLDKPVIQPGETNADGMERHENETEEDVMNRFNRLVTVNTEETSANSRLAFSEKIKGKVQDRDLKIEPEPFFALTLLAPEVSLRTTGNFFRELEELNSARYADCALYLSNTAPSSLDNVTIERLFALADSFSLALGSGTERPVDRLYRGIVRTLLKNYPAAMIDLDRAIEMKKDFTLAYMARASLNNLMNEKQAAVADLDKVLELDPRMVYAWFDKGLIYMESGDFTSAISCFTTAIDINPEFGEAYFNRAVAYLQLGNKQAGISDLSRAGELGILPSYNLLKRMK